MAQTLVLLDVTARLPKETGDSATLSDDGKVTYEGKGVENIIGRWLKVDPAEKVFNDFNGWSNGYASLKRRK
jgi:hypothetical protein